MKRAVSLILCLVLVAVSAVVVVYAGSVLEAKQAEARSIVQNGPKAVNVRVTVLEPSLVEDMLLLTGRIDPWEQAQLSAEVSGNVEWQGIEEGDTVKAGQKLVKIDTIWFQSARRQASAQEDLAQQELDRMRKLKSSGVSSPQDLDRAVTQQRVASADLAAAMTQLNKTVLVAPFEGVVNRLEREQGEWAEQGRTLVHLVQIDRVKAIIGIPERDIVHSGVGEAAVHQPGRAAGPPLRGRHLPYCHVGRLRDTHLHDGDRPRQ